MNELKFSSMKRSNKCTKKFASQKTALQPSKSVSTLANYHAKKYQVSDKGINKTSQKFLIDWLLGTTDDARIVLLHVRHNNALSNDQQNQLRHLPSAKNQKSAQFAS